MKQANQPGRVPNYFRNKYHGYDDDMPNLLPTFIKLLDTEKDEDGAGLNAAEQIDRELKSRKCDILKFRNLTILELPHLNEFLFSTELNPPISDQVIFLSFFSVPKLTKEIGWSLLLVCFWK